MVTPGHSGLLLFAQSREQALVGLLAPPWEPSELSAGSVSLLLGLPFWEGRQGPVFCGTLMVALVVLRFQVSWSFYLHTMHRGPRPITP